MKKSIYIETSIPSYYHEERKELEFQRGITRRWWDDERSQYFIYISEIVITELEKGNYPNKHLVIALVSPLSRLQMLSEIEGIVEVYINNSLMPKKHTGDAFHLVNKQEHIKVINERIGLSTPQIITPLQILFGKEKENDA